VATAATHERGGRAAEAGGGVGDGPVTARKMWPGGGIADVCGHQHRSCH